MNLAIKIQIFLVLINILNVCSNALQYEESKIEINPKKSGSREPKLSIFQIVRFPNVACVATNSKNGTCFTSSECTSKSGTSAGSCAQGFGVCCTFTVGCGQTSSQNCTYFEVSAAGAGNCRASICKCNSNVCQLRFDFLTFAITGPSTVTLSVGLGTSGQLTGAGKQVSTATQCLTDIFTITSPSANIPVICGTNTGEHVYTDASNNCNDLSFQLGSTGVGTTLAGSRSWQIKVTQYNCDYSNLAPTGCTQYFFGSTTGTVRSFNYQGAPAIHLANQKQQICVRRERNNCRICWTTAADTDFQVSGKTVNKGFTKGSSCCGYGIKGTITKGYDCVMIPGASNGLTPIVMRPNSYCGRSKGLVKSATGSIATTVCSRQTPFELSFYSDNWEFSDTIAEANKGFQLTYIETSC